jgi:DNA repair protein RadA/Sms
MNCQRCGETLPKGKFKCLTCGCWSPMEETAIVKADTALSVANNFGSVTLDEVVSADVDRLKTGPWDLCFGTAELDDGTIGDAGIVRGSVNLVGGSPGAGKSTLFLQMGANVIETTQLPVLYISGEEQLPQIKARAKRLRLAPEIQRMIRMVDVRKGGADLSAILQHFKFCLLFLDSLDAISGKDLNLEIEMIKIVKEYCTFQHAPGIVAKQVTKDETIAGLMSLQHEADATFTFFPDTERIVRSEKDEETIKAEMLAIKKGKMTGPIIPYVDEAVRILETQKNRNGPAFTTRELLMTSRGLVEYEEPEGDTDDNE